MGFPSARNFSTPTLIFADRFFRSVLRGKAKNGHRFGGPLDVSIKKWRRGHCKPQRVVTLDLEDPILALNETVAGNLPLIYGFRDDRCRLRYKCKSAREIEIVEFEGKKTRDWPYASYPEIFPSVPLSFKPPQPTTWSKWARDEDWSGLTPQDSQPRRNEMLVVVPPAKAFGVSLWGEMGDRARVTVVFRIDLAERTVEAWNECT